MIATLRPRIIDLYLARTVLLTTLATWAVLLGLDVMLSLVSEVSDIGKGSYDFSKAVAYMAYTVPRRAYTLFPTAAVIGSLMALMQGLGLAPVMSRATVSAVGPPETQADLGSLGAGGPLLLVAETCFTAAGQAVIRSLIYHAGHQFSFSFARK